MKAKDFRERAWDALKGNWLRAMLVTLVAALLSGTIGSHAVVNFSSSSKGNSESTESESGIHISYEDKTENVHSIRDAIEFVKEAAEEAVSQAPAEDQGTLRSIFRVLFAFFGAMLAFAAVRAVVGVVVGGAVSFGLAEYNFRLLEGDEGNIRDLFSRMYIGKGIGMRLLVGLRIFLWTLLLIVPGIIKSYAYSMTPYILSEHPDMTVREAIKASEKLMDGNKWRYFCLQFSFIGWDMLAALLTLRIGNLLLNPYKEAASAVFYKEICREAALR